MPRKGFCFKSKNEEIYRMDQVRLLCLLVSIAAVLFLLIGLIKPWMMLWWEDVQNRRKVIKLYGTVAIIFYALYIGLKFIPAA